MNKVNLIFLITVLFCSNCSNKECNIILDKKSTLNIITKELLLNYGDTKYRKIIDEIGIEYLETDRNFISDSLIQGYIIERYYLPSTALLMDIITNKRNCKLNLLIKQNTFYINFDSSAYFIERDTYIQKQDSFFIKDLTNINETRIFSEILGELIDLKPNLDSTSISSASLILSSLNITINSLNNNVVESAFERVHTKEDLIKKIISLDINDKTLNEYEANLIEQIKPSINRMVFYNSDNQSLDFYEIDDVNGLVFIKKRFVIESRKHLLPYFIM